jgi:hypothetical protein
MPKSDEQEIWEFTVWVYDQEGNGKMFGRVHNHDDALEQRRNALAVGWAKVKIVDADQNEVQEKPKS